ncbi:MAG: 3-dehydroquinate synthase [Deltaproteobacteria bacterium]|nr:3-dehydroquinate synthase [Deltaproteobacteria bacterium]
MKRIRVEAGRGGYEVALGGGLLGRLREVEAAAPHLRGRRVFVVTDRTVERLHGETFRRGLESAAAACVGWHALEPGEEHKTIGALCGLWDALVDAGVERGDCLAALGGGVVGDVAGFAAATYLRGIDFLQFPTTVLAVADSSVGGKTAVDHPRGKNLIGAFHQPRGVVADLEVLRTLPRREVLSGMAEVLKAGLIGDPELFRLLETGGPGLVEDPAALEDALARAVAVKARTVAADEREAGERALLNLGHTLGHAVEVAAGYGVFTHGEAVALGLGFAARLSRRLGMLEDADAERILRLLDAWGYPDRVSDELASAALRGVRYDKKSVGGAPRWVLLRAVGRAEWGRAVAPEIVETLLLETRESS